MRLEQLAREYEDRVDFLVVYIQEAHAADRWQVEVNERDDVVINQATSIEEREEAAQACSLRLDLDIPTVLDEMTNEVDRAYVTLPDRLYLVDAEGKIAFRGESGPAGFRPRDLERAIVELLA